MFKKSSVGLKLRAGLFGLDVSTSVLTIAEISFWCAREGKNPGEYVSAIKDVSNILFFDQEVALQAGAGLSTLRKISPHMGMVDAIIYAQAVSAGLPLVTGDPHFKNLPGVNFVQP